MTVLIGREGMRGKKKGENRTPFIIGAVDYSIHGKALFVYC